MPKTEDHNELRIRLSTSSRARLQDLSESSGRSITQLVRNGLALVEVILREQNSGNKCVIATRGGRAIKEIVLPP